MRLPRSRSSSATPAEKKDKKARSTSRTRSVSQTPSSPLSPVFAFVPSAKPISLTGRHPDTEPVLDTILAEQLRPFLPPLQRESFEWELIYSMDQHGISLSTLFNSAAGKGPAVLCIRDEQGRIFGAFASEELRLTKGYYGNGSSFLWKQNDRGGLTAYLSTGKNEYYLLSETLGSLAFGGGTGELGLWLDSDFNNGHSAWCQTFENEPLSGPEKKFRCAGLELWGFLL